MKLTNFDSFVTVGTVVDDWQRLLESRPSYSDDISDQLTDTNHHLRYHKQSQHDRDHHMLASSNLWRLHEIIQTDPNTVTSASYDKCVIFPPASVCGRRICVQCSRSCSSSGSRADEPRRCGWSSVWSYSTSESRSRKMHTYPHGPRKTYMETDHTHERKQENSNMIILHYL